MKTTIRTIFGITTAITTLALANASFAQSVEERRAAARERAEAGLRYLNDLMAKAQAEAAEQLAALANPLRVSVHSAALLANSLAAGDEAPALNSPLTGGSSCDLWLEIHQTSATQVTLTLHNTEPGISYRIWSTPDVAHGPWATETDVTGAAGTQTSLVVSMVGRPVLFFNATKTPAPGFRGLNETEAGAGVADTMGAVGPSHYVQFVNGRIAVFSKVDGTRLTETNMHSFIGAESQGTSDPRILFDHFSGRWIATALDFTTPRKVKLVVSQSDSPLPLDASNWRIWSIDMYVSPYSIDYDTLGFDVNGIYIAATQLDGSVVKGETVVAVKKPEIYLNNLVSSRFDLDLAPSDLKVGTIQPVVNFDASPAGGYAWLAGKGPPDHGATYRGGALYYRRLRWIGSTAVLEDGSWQIIAEPSPTYRDYFDLNEGSVQIQLGGGITSNFVSPPNGVGSRLMNAVLRDGNLYTCHHVGISGTGGGYQSNDASGQAVDRTGIQWFRLGIAAAGAGLQYLDHSRVYDACTVDPFYYYFPSLAVNSRSDVVLGFSGARNKNYLSAFYSWRTGQGQTLTTPGLIKTGISYFGGLYPGDYSSTTLDPNDGLTIWTVQEYADHEDIDIEFGRWGSWISSIQVTP